uniref:Uncharacterized protein n=1 Tax=Arundo donax TaxID=35708 RepID=A0A0A9AP18_ARUDO
MFCISLSSSLRAFSLCSSLVFPSCTILLVPSSSCHVVILLVHLNKHGKRLLMFTCHLHKSSPCDGAINGHQFSKIAFDYTINHNLHIKCTALWIESKLSYQPVVHRPKTPFNRPISALYH